MEEKIQTEPTDVQLELLKVAKKDSTKINSIQKNLQFIAWYLIISLIVSALVLAMLYGKVGYFRAY